MSRPSRSTGLSLNRKLFTSADDLAALDEVDAVPGQPGEQQGLRVDLADVPEAGQQQAALGVGDHLVEAAGRVAASPSAGCRRRGHRQAGQLGASAGSGSAP